MCATVDSQCLEYFGYITLVTVHSVCNYYLPEIKEVMARKRVAIVVDLFWALLVIIKQVTPVQTKITESPILTP